MARPLRSVLTIAGSSLAGPSRVSTRARAPVQVRTAWNMADLSRNLRLPWSKENTSTTSTTNEPLPAEITDEPTSSSDAQGSLFDSVTAPVTDAPKNKKKLAKRGTNFEWTEHSYSSAPHKISPRKLNLLSRQIAGLPVDEAIVQMQFSEKRASKWVKSTLALARDHAMDKNLKRDKLVVSEAWVSKGQKIGRIDIKGRGKYGILHHQSARIHVVLREGKTVAEKQQVQYDKAIRKVRSAGQVREDLPLRRKVVSGWTW
ncbi:hypothetical protein L202_04470 [Cryptococcus amylolentus CBS 6039]|uniref:Ribosomal protein L22 n=2 Tax=Cryptococcus amylolentus TaxID=104669 RepID=A0A1E3HRJ0_9TREE|nr:hypothetical protein L202_04470 [Cryptococcus amylolentus CBS 6039]ODN78954.1 hypothetical protein L202_04470 [Cryptococcus amylolentus CBS 6039]ODO06595.1 hypothetical protein I350_03951 [Cryptococcus amylolentus CBS 6273]